MSDVIDLAQELEERQRAAALRPILATAADLQHFRGGFDCIACFDEIPVQRLAAVPGAQRCAFCQELAERRLRTHASR